MKTVEISGFKVTYHDGIWKDLEEGDFDNRIIENRDRHHEREAFLDTIDTKAREGYSCIVIDVSASLTPELCSRLDKLNGTQRIAVTALGQHGLLNDIIRLQTNTKEKTIVFLVGDIKPGLFPEPTKPKATMKYKPGFTYRTANGDEVTLTLVEYPLQGSNGMTYTEDGKVNKESKSKSDLVSLVTPDHIKVMGEHEGKYYGAELNNRSGWVPASWTQEELEAICGSK